MPAPYRLAIFDFDGTLADSFTLFCDAYNQLAARHGFRQVGAEEARELRALHAREIIRRVETPMWKLPIVSGEYIGIMRARRDEVSPFPGTAGMLQGLREAGIAIAIVSSNAEDNVRAVLGEAGAATVSHFACGMSIFGKRAHLRQALGAAGVAAPQAIYVGDQAADFDAARAEGIAFGAVTWGYGDAAHLRELAPAHVFEHVEEVASLLTRPGSPGSAP